MLMNIIVTANTLQDGEDNFEHVGVDRQQLGEILRQYYDELEAGVWSSLVVVISRVQS